MNNEQQHKKISDKILEVIDTKEVKPTSKLFFRAKNISLWIFAGCSLIIGGLVVSIIIFRLSNADAIKDTIEANDLITTIFAILPVVWIILLGLFGYGAYEEIRHTRKGYKYEFTTIMITLVLGSVAFGLLMHSLGSGYFLDSLLDNKVPFHRGVESLQKEKFMRPERGLLAGEVVKKGNNGFYLEDLDDKVWHVTYASDVNDQDENLVVRDAQVKVMGVKVSDDEFVACRISPLATRGKGLFKKNAPLMIQDNMNQSTTTTERNKNKARNNVCEGVRPLMNAK